MSTKKIEEVLNSLNEADKTKLLTEIAKLKNIKVNLLLVGATGVGKSSTINALFATEKAKVGQGVDPETMDISKYELDNIVVWDSPGLGDSPEKDVQHARKISKLLNDKDENGNLLIDLVLVLLDGSSRDYGTAYRLISDVIVPDLGNDKSRLLIGINKVDMAGSRRGWDHELNQPTEELTKILDEKVASTQKRIREATGISVQVICFTAGYKDGSDEQKPWNLSKLLLFILDHVKEEKRIVFAKDLNSNFENWVSDDGRDDYRRLTQEKMGRSLQDHLKAAGVGAAVGAEIGSIVPGVGTAIGAVVGGLIGAASSFFDLF